MSRKMVDCRDFPSDKKCSLALTGEEEEVVRAASEHAVSFHGYPDSSELREKIRKALKDEPSELERQKTQSVA